MPRRTHHHVVQARELSRLEQRRKEAMAKAHAGETAHEVQRRRRLARTRFMRHPLAWVGGILDGKLNVQFKRSRRRGELVVSAVRVWMRGEWDVLLAVSQHLEGGVVRELWLDGPCEWVVPAAEQRRVLMRALPWMCNERRKEAIRAALRFRMTKPSRRVGGEVSQAVLDARETYVRQARGGIRDDVE